MVLYKTGTYTDTHARTLQNRYRYKYRYKYRYMCGCRQANKIPLLGCFAGIIFHHGTKANDK